MMVKHREERQKRRSEQYIPVLWSRSRHAHRAVAAVDSLHLHQSTLLVGLVGKANKAVATALARHGVRHDLGALAGGEASLEERHKDILIDLRAKIADEDGVFRTAILTVGLNVS
jgi:hypothetical protein